MSSTGARGSRWSTRCTRHPGVTRPVLLGITVRAHADRRKDRSGGISGTTIGVRFRSTFRPDLLRVRSPTAPATRRRTGRLSLGGVAPRWRWLLVTLAALAVSCVVPGSVLSQTPPAGRAAVITGVAPAPSSECAAVSCNRGSSSSTAPLGSVSLAGTIAAAMLVLLAPFAVLRARRCAGNLPAGTPSPLLRPPQHLVCA